MGHERMIGAPVGWNGVPRAGHRCDSDALLGAAAGQGNQTQDGFDAWNGEVIHLVTGEYAAHMGLNKPWCKIGNAGAGVILIGMHRFIVAHHCGGRSLTGAEQRRAFGLTNGQVDELYASPLGLSPFRSDRLQYILATRP